jgi:hypothetical protein
VWRPRLLSNIRNALVSAKPDEEQYGKLEFLFFFQTPLAPESGFWYIMRRFQHMGK